jgi:dTDP-4-dehydrorhamnose reductase
MTSAAPILLVGRSGRVSRALVEEARRRNLPVRALGRPELDIENPDSIKRVVDAEMPRAIVNCAGLVVVDAAECDPDWAFRINRDGPAHLAKVAAGCGIPFVHLSSDYVFDGSKMAPYREDDPPRPVSVYGRSKAAGEAAVLAACPAAIVVRTSWIYGSHEPNFVTTMLRAARTQSSVRVVCDQRGSPTADTDLAGALLEIASGMLDKKAGHDPGLYHVAGSGEATWSSLAEALFAGWAKRGHRVPAIEPIALADWPGEARRPLDSRLDCGKAERVFGIRLPEWRVSLERFLDSFALTDPERH